MSERRVAEAPEQGAILSCLSGIRWRLYGVRLAERAALALGWGAVVALFIAGGRILIGPWPFWGVVLALLPLAGGAGLWCHADRLSSMTLAKSAGMTPLLLRLAGIVTALIALSGAVVLAFHLMGWLPVWGFAAGTVGLMVLAGGLTVRPVAPGVAAIFVDQQAGLEERVSTALELFESSPHSDLEAAFRAPVIASAVRACQNVRAARVGYGRIDTRLYALAATLAIAAAGLSLITPLQARASAARQPYRAVAAKGETLAEKIRQLEATHQIKDPALDKKFGELRNVAEQMRQGNMSPFEANDKLSALAKELQDQQAKQNSAADVEKALMASKEMQALGKAADDLKSASLNASGDAPGSQAQSDAQNKIKSAAGELAGKLAGMSDKDKKDLANQLKDASDKSKDPQTKQDLADAAKAAEQGDSQKMEQSLADAGNQIGQQGAQSQLSSDAVRQAMDQIAQAQGGGQSAGEQQAGGGHQQEGQQQANGGNQGQGAQGGNQGGKQGGQEGQANNQGGGKQGGQEGGAQGQQAMAGAGNDSQMGNSGSTDIHAPSGPGDHQIGRPIGDSRTMVRMYEEKPIDSRGKVEGTPGHINPMGVSSGSIQTLAAGDKDPSTIRTYESELPAARRRALDDLQTQQIPPQYKDLVRAFYGD